MTDILITDYHCASNRGDAAILEGELEALKNEFSDPNITVLTDYPDAADLIHDVEVHKQALSNFSPTAIKRNLAVSYLILDSAVRSNRLRLPGSNWIIDTLNAEPYYEADIVISTGGQFITDAYFPNKVGVLAELYLCTQLGVPVAIYGQSLGPFEDIAYEGLIRHVLNEIDLIMTRDEPSVEHLQKLGVTETPIHSLTDAAFTMPLDAEPKPLESFFNTEINLKEAEGPRISVSTRHWGDFDEGSEEEYFKAVAETVTWLIEEYDAHIVFASTCTGLAGYHTDDRVAAIDVMEYIPNEKLNSIHLVTEEQTSQSLVKIYERMDLHIGTRMHSCILSILGGTPAVGIEYQFKTSGLYQKFDLEEYTVNIDNITEEKLKNIVSKALDEKGKIIKEIDKNMPEIKEYSQQNASNIKGLVE